MFGASFFLDPSAEEETKQLIIETEDKIHVNKNELSEQPYFGDIDNEEDSSSGMSACCDSEPERLEILDKMELERSKYLVFGYYKEINNANNCMMPIGIIEISVSYYNVHIQQIVIAPDGHYNDPIVTFDVKPYHSIGHIKKRMNCITNLKRSVLILTYNQLTLEYDHFTLFDYDIKDGECIKYRYWSQVTIRNESNKTINKKPMASQYLVKQSNKSCATITNFDINAEAKLCGGTVKNNTIHYCHCCYDNYKEKAWFNYYGWDCWYC